MALIDSAKGVVMSKDFPANSVIPMPSIYPEEFEYLVPGTVTGASPTRVPAW